MPIQYVKGDIFASTAQVIVNTVNCRGVMGKGLALKFRKRYPKMYEEYKLECYEGRLRPGKLHLYKERPGRWILNFPTKDDWRRKSKLEYIEAGLTTFVREYKTWDIESIAFPKLGCQLGGLSWRNVRPLMEQYLKDLPGLSVDIYVRPGKKGSRKGLQSDGKQKTLTEYG